MKRLVFFVLISLLVNPSSAILSAKEDRIVHKMNHGMEESLSDSRIPLRLSPEMKQHQLKNMRRHLEAVQKIIRLLAERRFEQASRIAHSELGLTEEMKKMCNMYDNEDFKSLGLEFHKSADKLAEVLKTKDLNRALTALNSTLDFCISCHKTFRQ